MNKIKRYFYCILRILNLCKVYAKTLKPGRRNPNVTAYSDILVLPTLWQQFREDLFLFLHDNTPVHQVP